MDKATIENPILNSPFEEPKFHFRFTDEGIAFRVSEKPGAITLVGERATQAVECSQMETG